MYTGENLLAVWKRQKARVPNICSVALCTGKLFSTFVFSYLWLGKRWKRKYKSINKFWREINGREDKEINGPTVPVCTVHCVNENKFKVFAETRNRPISAFCTEIFKSQSNDMTKQTRQPFQHKSKGHVVRSHVPTQKKLLNPARQQCVHCLS
jgi:hypothetical protein